MQSIVLLLPGRSARAAGSSGSGSPDQGVDTVYTASVPPDLCHDAVQERDAAQGDPGEDSALKHRNLDQALHR